MTSETTRIGVLAGLLALSALPGFTQMKSIHMRSVAPPAPTSPLRVVDSQDYSVDPILHSLASLQTETNRQLEAADAKFSQITISAISADDVNRVAKYFCQHPVKSCNLPLSDDPAGALGRAQAIANDIMTADQAAFAVALKITGMVPASVTNREIADLEQIGIADSRIRPAVPPQRTPSMRR